MYTLERFSIKKEIEMIILDLYDHKNEKSVVLHYSFYYKNIDMLIFSTLSILTGKTLDLITWDNIVHQFITNKKDIISAE